MQPKRESDNSSAPCTYAPNDCEDKMFLTIVNDPSLRTTLLERLQDLELLASFLEAENGTS